MAKKQKGERVHEFVIRVAFDRPTTKAWALAEVKDCIHGVFFTSGLHEDNQPETFQVRSFKPLPRSR